MRLNLALSFMLVAGCAELAPDPETSTEAAPKPLLDSLLAGETVNVAPIRVENTLFLPIDEDEPLYLRVNLADADAEIGTDELERIAGSSVRARLVDKLASDNYSADLGDPATVLDAVAAGRVTTKLELAGVTGRFSAAGVFVRSITGQAPECKTRDGWFTDDCGDTGGASCSFTMQMTCHSWQWQAIQGQVMCINGSVVTATVGFNLVQVEYQTPLTVSGSCGVERDWWDHECACFVQKQPNCPSMPPPPPPAVPPPPCPGNTCTTPTGQKGLRAALTDECIEIETEIEAEVLQN